MGLMTQTKSVMVAACQINSKFKKKNENLRKMIKMAEIAAGNGVKLIAFPELALTGMGFDSSAEALSAAENIPGTITEELVSNCTKLDLYVVTSLLEKEENKCYNTSILVGPDGLVGKYRKAHLAHLGADQCLHKGNETFEVFETKFAKIGLVICYELRFPEIHRVLSLRGAEIIVNVTSLPMNLGLECHQDLLGPTRALENKVYFVSANRVGRGEGFTFLGRSQIIDLNGKIIVEAGQEKEEIIHAQIEPRRARNKGVELNPAQDLFVDRRPELYGPIVGEGFS